MSTTQLDVKHIGEQVEAASAPFRRLQEEMHRVINGMRDRGVLINYTGQYGNLLKMRPPMPFSRENADLLLTTLDDALADV